MYQHGPDPEEEQDAFNQIRDPNGEVISLKNLAAPVDEDEVSRLTLVLNPKYVSTLPNLRGVAARILLTFLHCEADDADNDGQEQQCNNMQSPDAGVVQQNAAAASPASGHQHPHGSSHHHPTSAVVLAPAGGQGHQHSHHHGPGAPAPACNHGHNPQAAGGAPPAANTTCCHGHTTGPQKFSPESQTQAFQQNLLWALRDSIYSTRITTLTWDVMVTFYTETLEHMTKTTTTTDSDGVEISDIELTEEAKNTWLSEEEVHSKSVEACKLLIARRKSWVVFFVYDLYLLGVSLKTPSKKETVRNPETGVDEEVEVEISLNEYKKLKETEWKTWNTEKPWRSAPAGAAMMLNQAMAIPAEDDDSLVLPAAATTTTAVPLATFGGEGLDPSAGSSASRPAGATRSSLPTSGDPVPGASPAPPSQIGSGVPGSAGDVVPPPPPRATLRGGGTSAWFSFLSWCLFPRVLFVSR